MKLTDKITIHPAFLILLAFLILTVPLRWLLAWCLAAAVHELGHILAARLLGGRIFSIRLTCTGAYIVASVSGVAGGLSSLAGPGAGLLLLPLGKWLPRTAVCALCQSACNLLPVWPLDGGRAVRSFLAPLGPVGERISGWIGSFVLWSLALAAAVLWVSTDAGPLPAVFVVILAIKAGKGKYPCKYSLWELQ